MLADPDAKSQSPASGWHPTLRAEVRAISAASLKHIPAVLGLFAGIACAQQSPKADDVGNPETGQLPVIPNSDAQHETGPAPCKSTSSDQTRFPLFFESMNVDDQFLWARALRFFSDWAERPRSRESYLA
jgi:hypothetical protein